ncbi:MAG: RsmE family RNA methyltransferase [Candidatus Omnitrophota bacterium]
MSRFYVPKENVDGSRIRIEGHEARHVLNVMRLSVSDRVVVFDGTGNEYVGFIRETRPGRVVVEIVETKIPAPEDMPRVTLAQAVPKKGRMDYIVQKATELGVYRIIPVFAERCVAQTDPDRGAVKAKRWQRIAEEAAKQCGRKCVPEISRVTEFREAVNDIENYDLALAAWLSDDTVSLKAAISGFSGRSVVVFIGPEGDFTPGEMNMAMTHPNCKAVSLGRRVLKSDTAGLFALSCLNYELT